MMDRNQTIGFVLIFALTAAYFLYMGNTEPAPQVVAEKAATAIVSDSNTISKPTVKPVIAPISGVGTAGKNKEVVLENTDLKITFQTKGAVITDVLVKNQFTFDKKPLHLITPTNNQFGLKSLNRENKTINLYSLFYQVEQKGNTLVFFVNDSLGNQLTHTYTLPESGYALKYEIGGTAIKSWFNSVAPMELTWNNSVDKIEYDKDQSTIKTTVNYYTEEDGFDQISEASKEEEDEAVRKPVKWVSLKQKFFNIGIISKNTFSKVLLKTTPNNDPEKVKNLSASLIIGAESIQKDTLAFTYFFGPNLYKTCKDMGNDYEKNVYLGWPIINGVNRFIVIPVFDFLQTYISNYGIIIIILVLLIKLLLLPLSYKSYISMAKMKVMKPELDQIKAENGDDMQKTQAAQMKLYQQVGINPLSGCIPVVLQMPILLAMFNFFPSSFELRQEAFLWAPDLSTYDAPILLGFTIPFYGNHVSIFTILMTISTLAYTYLNNQVSTAATGPMKSISYAMPVVFMFVLNSFPAGLSFYYLMSNVVTIAQQLIIRKFVDEDSIKAKLDENRAKIASGQGGGKKSKWMQKVEDAMKAQEEIKKAKKK